MPRTLAAALAALALLLVAAPSPTAAVRLLQSGPAAPDITAPLVAVVALVAWSLAAWLLLTAVLTAGSRLRGALGSLCGAALRRTAPATVRHAVALALGFGALVGGAGPASALPPAPAPAATAPASTAPASTAPAGTAPAGTAPEAASPPAAVAWPSLDWPGSPATAATERAAVVVEPGDSLWALAAERLPAAAAAAEIAVAWPTWWSANREVIGDDPDLLLPGQRLQVPDATATTDPA